MESQVSTGPNGTQPVQTQGYTHSPLASSPISMAGYILRVVVVILTFLATVVMGTAKESVTVVGVDQITGASLSVSGSVKSVYSAAFVYFVVIHVIAFLYSSVSLALSLANRASLSGLVLPFTVADLAVTVLLFSSNSAAAAISVVAEKGQSRLGWDKICDVVGKFCARVTASIVLSMLASVAYLALLLIGIFGVRKRS